MRRPSRAVRGHGLPLGCGGDNGRRRDATQRRPRSMHRQARFDRGTRTCRARCRTATLKCCRSQRRARRSTSAGSSRTLVGQIEGISPPSTRSQAWQRHGIQAWTATTSSPSSRGRAPCSSPETSSTSELRQERGSRRSTPRRVWPWRSMQRPRSPSRQPCCGAYGMATLDASTGRLLDWPSATVPSYLFAFARAGRRLYVGGELELAGSNGFLVFPY